MTEAKKLLPHEVVIRHGGSQQHPKYWVDIERVFFTSQKAKSLAKLLRAAPDLLAACERVSEWMESWGDTGESFGVNAAIKKVKGGE